MANQVLPSNERAAMARHLAQIDLIETSLKDVDADIARQAMADPIIRRLMTLPGVDMTVASGVAAAIGDIRRFAEPSKLVGYLGLNPSVRQSGEGPAYHGRIASRGAVRHVACWLKRPGQRHDRQDRSEHSIDGSPPSAASIQRPSRLLGSWR